MKPKKLTIPLGSTKSNDESRRRQWVAMLVGSLDYLTRDQLAEECRKRNIPIAKLKYAMARRLAEHVIDAGLPVTVTIG